MNLWCLFVLTLNIIFLVFTENDDFQPIAPVVKAQPLKSNWEDEDVDEDDVKESWEEEEEVLERFAHCLVHIIPLSPWPTFL